MFVRDTPARAILLLRGLPPVLSSFSGLLFFPAGREGRTVSYV